MSHLNRRELCKIIAAVPLLRSVNSIAAPLSSIGQYQSFPNEITVNILLHGMFAIHIYKDQNKGIDLFPPHVKGDTPHIYLSSDLKTDPPVFQWLQRGTTYTIAPHGGTSVQPAPDIAINAVANLSDTIKRDTTVAPHCTINVPWPDRIVPLRSKKPLSSSDRIFKKAVGLVFEPPQLPLVTMLQYVVGSIDMGQPLLTNYHLFAEPQECPCDAHPTQAFDTLRSLYKGLDGLVINGDLKARDFGDVDDPVGTGITRADEHAIVELDDLNCDDDTAKPGRSGGPPQLRNRRSKGAGGADIPTLAIHPTACMSLILIEPQTS